MRRYLRRRVVTVSKRTYSSTTVAITCAVVYGAAAALLRSRAITRAAQSNTLLSWATNSVDDYRRWKKVAVEEPSNPRIPKDLERRLREAKMTFKAVEKHCEAVEKYINGRRYMFLLPRIPRPEKAWIEAADEDTYKRDWAVFRHLFPDPNTVQK